MLKRLLGACALGVILMASVCFGMRIYSGGFQADADLGQAEDGGQWISFQQFNGLQTKYDPEKIQDGANSNGQNTTANAGDRISIRSVGYDLFPSGGFYQTTSTGIETMHTFRRRSGENILLRATSSTLQWFDGQNDTWEVLKTGYQTGDFGYADNNVNTDQSSYVYFGNGKDPFSRWTGNHTFLTSAASGGDVTLNVSDTTGFPATGSITYCGTTMAYSGKTATTFTVVSATACGAGRGIAESVQEFTDQTAYPRGNLYLFTDNRLWIAGTTSTQNIIYFSAYGTSTVFDANSLVSSSTAADPGVFNLAEGGGPVTALVYDEGSIYAFKPSLIYKITLSDTLYSVQPLKAFDGKSQSTGAVTRRNVFSTPNGVFYMTPDNQIMLLTRIEYIDYPQSEAISDIIKPTVDDLYFTSSTGIVFQDKLYFAVKSTEDAPVNDVVLVYNLHEKFWDSPIIGWSVAEWAIYNDSGLEELYFSDGTTPNTYKVINQPLDYQYDTVASWRSKQFTFGLPHAQKYMSNVYVEGYISPSTEITISLLLDEDGYTRRYQTVLSGTDSQYIYDSTLYNVFGVRPFGTTRFGAQEDLTGKKKFRVYLGKDFQQIPFYNASIQFDSDGQNSQWEITNFAFNIRPAPVPEKSSLYKAFK